MAAGVDYLTAGLPRSSDLSGAVLEGAYRLVRLIGRGGTGAVYEAIQLRLKKRVAVKIMSRELTSSVLALERFHREAEITSRLGHPHLINVMDFGTAESGEPYLAMEFLDGEDLQARLEKVKRFPLEATVRIIGQAASALDVAHAQGIVHRDMKPANIFLLRVPGETEFVKVLDFGISKMKDARERVTRNTAVLGTPIYMSPELTLGKFVDPDHRADQWALACIAWEMLSGNPPFDSEDIHVLFHRINHVEPPPLAYPGRNRGPGVEAVLRKALSKDVQERYPSIREFAHAFEHAAFGHSKEAVPPLVFQPSSACAAESSRKTFADVVVSPKEDSGSGLARARPMWRRPIMAVAGAAGLALLGAAVSLIGSSSLGPIASKAATPIPSATAQTQAVASSSFRAPNEAEARPVALPIPVTIEPKQPARSKEPKRTRSSKSAANTGSIPNQEAAQTRPRPWIFEDL